jgi:hypothetical protein
VDAVWTNAVSPWFDRADKGQEVLVAVSWGYEGDEAKVGSMGPHAPSRGSGLGRLQATRPPPPWIEPDPPTWVNRLQARLELPNPFTDDWGKPGFSEGIVTIDGSDTQPTLTRVGHPALPTGLQELTEGRMGWRGGTPLVEGNGYSASGGPYAFWSEFVTVRFLTDPPLPPGCLTMLLPLRRFSRRFRRRPNLDTIPSG